MRSAGDGEEEGRKEKHRDEKEARNEENNFYSMKLRGFLQKLVKSRKYSFQFFVANQFDLTVLFASLRI